MRIPLDWTFENSEVARGFDEHVREQLPWYDLVTGAIAHFARCYVPEGGLVYDIGASTGNVGRAIESTLVARGATLVAIERSPAMANLYRGPGEVRVEDAVTFRYGTFDFAVAFLCLSFIPLKRRDGFVALLRGWLRHGGAIVVVDKVASPGGYLGTVLSRLTLAGKVAAGVPPADVVAKELSLAGAQRPIDPSILGAGAVEWWRFGEFAGWLVEG